MITCQFSGKSFILLHFLVRAIILSCSSFRVTYHLSLNLELGTVRPPVGAARSLAHCENRLMAEEAE